MSNIKKFSYKGSAVSFEFSDGNKMINATQMAKPFGKLVGHFLSLKSTKEYIAALESRYRDYDIGKNREVLRVVKGGSPELQGTWMDEKLALKCASWLAVEFELWVYDRIHELLTTGKTELPNITNMPIVDALRKIADHIEEQEVINEEVKERLKEIEAKITSIDESYYTIAGYCNLNSIPCPINRAKKWGKTATQLSNDNGIPTGVAHNERFGQVRTYHKEVLKRVIR